MLNFCVCKLRALNYLFLKEKGRLEKYKAVSQIKAQTATINITSANNGFNNVAPAASAPNGEIKVFKPQQANQYEGGIKMDLFDGKLSGTLSYYNIKISNATYTDPSNAAYTIQDGTQRSKGFEADLTASPLKGLNIVASYGYNENKYIQSSTSLKGKYVTYAPKNIGNLWISYRMSGHTLKGFGLGAGGNAISDSWFNATNTFVLPGYTLWNAAIFYDQPKYNLSFKVNNISNEQYWNISGTAQMPRNIALSVSFKF